MADETQEPVVEAPLGDAPVDHERVTSLPGYRVGFLPPAPGSLAAGELYVELTPSDAPGIPALWMGLPSYIPVEGGVVKLVSVSAPAKAETKTEEPKTEPEHHHENHDHGRHRGRK